MTQNTPPQPIQLQGFLTYRLARVQSKLNAQGIRVLKEVAGLGLSQWRVIAMIKAGEGNIALTADLIRSMGLDKGLISRTVRKLKEAGLVKAVADPVDHRRQLLALTDAGHAIYDQTLPAMQRRQEKLREALEPGQLDALISALNRLEAAVDSEELE